MVLSYLFGLLKAPVDSRTCGTTTTSTNNISSSSSASDNSLCADSTLYDLVVDMNWDRVLWYARAFPQTARFQDGDTMETPLHAAVQVNPTVSVVRALIQADPTTVLVQARNGESPLHMACRYQASVEVLRELVQQQPASVLLETKFGSTPIVALWRSCHRSTETIRPENDMLLWQKMRILLQAVARCRHEKSCSTTCSDDATLFMVHAAISLGSLGSPIQVLDFCLREYPHQVQQVDSNGLLPLHLAVGPTRWTCGSKRRYKPREKEPIQRLLQQYPNAASIPDPQQGRLPLHSALVNGHEWLGGVQALVQCYPVALWQPDPVSGLVPFLAAATSDSAMDLTTIYNLLCVGPNALQMNR